MPLTKLGQRLWNNLGHPSGRWELILLQASQSAHLGSLTAGIPAKLSSTRVVHDQNASKECNHQWTAVKFISCKLGFTPVPYILY